MTGPGLLTLKGRAGNGRTNGTYRGALEFRGGTFGGVNAINALPVDEYVKGVIPLESPASWPIEALKAQAVAARTYALTTSKAGDGFEHYPDTRSQVYGGAGAEQPSTNQAADATAGQLVTYDGTPVPTYFFSTSGGRTEDVENTTLGDEPKPWLKSVEDEYDSVSPKHRWGPIRMTYRAAGRKLRGLVQGRFKGVKVVRRGSSPRVVEADVIGSAGRTRVDGATLRARFGLFDSWAYFTSIKTRTTPPPCPRPRPAAQSRSSRACRRSPASPGTSCPRARERACSPAPHRRALGHGRLGHHGPQRPLSRRRARDRPLPRALQGRRGPGRARASALVDARQRLGDADRLVAALALERALDRDLRAARDVLERLQPRVHAHALPTGSGAGKRTLLSP